MITWIQTVLQKHHKPVFCVLLVAITIAFVFTIGEIPFFGDKSYSSERDNNRFGYDFSNPAVVNSFQQYAWYDALLQGMPNLTDEQVLMQAYCSRVAENLGMTSASDADLKEYIQSAPLFMTNGKFDAKKWEEFKTSMLSKRISEESLVAILKHNALVYKVAKLIGGPGYVMNSEVKKMYELRNGSWDFAMAELSYAKFNPTISVTKEKLEDFFKKNVESFRVSRGVVVEAVVFRVEDFQKQVSSPKESDLKTYYTHNANKYQETKDGKTVALPFDSVKDRVKADYIADASKRATQKAAGDFALKIYNSEAKMGSPELKKLFEESKLVTKKLPELRESDVSNAQGMPYEVAKAAIKLDSTKFFSDAIAVGESEAWVVVLSEELKSYLPKLDEVKVKVEAAYKAAEKEKLFIEKGKALVEKLRKEVKAGKSFADIAKADGFTCEDIKAFSFAKPTQNRTLMLAGDVLESALPSLKVGEISDMRTSRIGIGYIVLLNKFTASAVDAKELETMKEYLERVSSGRLASFVISNAVADEIKRTEPQQQPQQ